MLRIRRLFLLHYSLRCRAPPPPPPLSVFQPLSYAMLVVVFVVMSTIVPVTSGFQPCVIQAQCADGTCVGAGKKYCVPYPKSPLILPSLTTLAPLPTYCDLCVGLGCRTCFNGQVCRKGALGLGICETPARTPTTTTTATRTQGGVTPTTGGVSSRHDGNETALWHDGIELLRMQPGWILQTLCG